ETDTPDVAGCGGFRAAHSLRKRWKSSAGQINGPAERDRNSSSTRSCAFSSCSSVLNREHTACNLRRSARVARRSVEHKFDPGDWLASDSVAGRNRCGLSSPAVYGRGFISYRDRVWTGAGPARIETRPERIAQGGRQKLGLGRPRGTLT